MYRVQLPYTTRTTGIDAIDFNNIFRVRELDTQIHMLNQDDGTFYKVLNMFSRGPSVSQPVYHWIEDDMLNIHTNVNNAGGYLATDTSIVVDDSLLCVINTILTNPNTFEQLLVTNVNYSTHTLTVTRGYAGTAAAPLADNDPLISVGDYLPERGSANAGTGSLPVTQTFNYISRISTSFDISHMQEVAAMVDGIGKVEREVVNKLLETKRKINKALIFNKRALETTSDGALYVSNGFLNYIQDNVLNLADVGGNLSWPILSDFLYPIYTAKASSPTKACIAGPHLFAQLAKIQRELEVGERPYFEPGLGTQVMRIVTDEGADLQVMLDKWGFPASEGLAGWGMIVDMSHVQLREYNGEPLSWRQNIQDPDSHMRKDELWGSFSLQLKFPSCHGFIRGAPARSISR